MNCIKCGKKLKDSKTFCAECLEQAADYPVDPATPLTLPRSVEPVAAKKRPRKRAALSPEEQLPRMRATIRVLIAALFLLFLAFLLTAWICFTLLESRDQISPQSAVSVSQTQTL